MKRVILATAAVTALSNAATNLPIVRINPCAARKAFATQLALVKQHSTPCDAIDCTPCNPCAAVQVDGDNPCHACNPCAVSSPCVPCNPCAAIEPDDEGLPKAKPCEPKATNS